MKKSLIILALLLPSALIAQPLRTFYRDYFGIHPMPENSKLLVQKFDSVCQHADSIIFWVKDDICKAEYKDSLNKARVGSNYKPTHYKAGFRYTSENGEKCMLLKYIKEEYSYLFLGIDSYRWLCRRTKDGKTWEDYTDDEWIDIYTGKAYLDNKQHKIIYYKPIEDKQSEIVSEAQLDSIYNSCDTESPVCHNGKIVWDSVVVENILIYGLRNNVREAVVGVWVSLREEYEKNEIKVKYWENVCNTKLTNKSLQNYQHYLIVRTNNLIKQMDLSMLIRSLDENAETHFHSSQKYKRKVFAKSNL